MCVVLLPGGRCFCLVIDNTTVGYRCDSLNKKRKIVAGIGCGGGERRLIVARLIVPMMGRRGLGVAYRCVR